MRPTPFKENRLSVAECEIILLDRKYPPPTALVAIPALTVGIFATTARLQHTGHLAFSAFEGLVAAALTLVVVPLLYYWRSNQLWVPTTLLANAEWVQGYTQHPSHLWHFVTEAPLQLNWQQVTQAAICHRPWVFAADKAELDLVLKDGTQVTFRLPRLVDQELHQLFEVLQAIGKRQGLSVKLRPFNKRPRLWGSGGLVDR